MTTAIDNTVSTIITTTTTSNGKDNNDSNSCSTRTIPIKKINKKKSIAMIQASFSFFLFLDDH